ncbi:RNA polymerase sigma factor [Streptomyces sp. NPDC088746]|uniref:RNA polymerase sigma factor n=1 Tax=Streptomyces sp. NPDC088746 TaxID=3365885 RepID=UPI0037FB5905
MYEGTTAASAAGQTSIVTGTDAVLSDVFAAHADRLTRTVFHSLDRADWQLAEDIVSETFLRLVRDYSGRPIDLDRVGGLLRTIARHAITDHYRLRRTGETPIDTTDWFEANRLPVDYSAEEYALADLTARALLADSAAPLGVAA